MQQQELCYITVTSVNENSDHSDHKIILKSSQSKHSYALMLQITVFTGFLWSSMTEPYKPQREERTVFLCFVVAFVIFTPVKALSDWHLSSLLTHLPTPDL